MPRYMEHGIHVVLAPEQLGTFFGIPLTNTLLTSWVVVILLTLFTFFVGKKVKIIPTKIQLLFESLIEYVLSYMEETLESKELARRFFPLIATLFLFIFFANLIEFTPGIGSIGLFHEAGEFVPLFRSVNTDLNVTPSNE